MKEVVNLKATEDVARYDCSNIEGFISHRLSICIIQIVVSRGELGKLKRILGYLLVIACSKVRVWFALL